LYKPKRIAVHSARYAADEGGVRTNIETWLKDSHTRLLESGENRFSDYDDLAFFHLLVGDVQQIAFGRTEDCKRHLYQSAVYKSWSCRYYALQPPEYREPFMVNLRALDYFEAAVAAGAEDAARTLGEQLLSADQSEIPYDVVKMESAMIHLFNGEDGRAKACCDAVSKHERDRWKRAYSKVGLFEAILEGDNQKFYDLFADSLRGNRRDRNLVHFLDLLHIAIGRIAIKRGLDLPVDTADCPQCLLRPEACDYSSIELQEPVEGLPW